MAEAAHDDHGDYHRGEMDIHEQRSTYDVFMGLTKWGSLVIAALVLFLSLAFATEAGVFTGLIAAVVLIAAGVFLLRDKRPADSSSGRPH